MTLFTILQYNINSKIQYIKCPTLKMHIKQTKKNISGEVQEKYKKSQQYDVQIKYQYILQILNLSSNNSSLNILFPSIDDLDKVRF